MYEIGTKVIYKNEGVCEITDIIIRNFRGQKMEYYVLKPMHKKGAEVYVPTKNNELVGKMRKIIDRQSIIELIRSVHNEGIIWIDNGNERKEFYREILAKGDRKDLLKLIKTLHIHKQNQKEAGKKLHISDERFLKDAEYMIYDEFSYVLDIPQNEVLAFIMDKAEKL